MVRYIPITKFEGINEKGLTYNEVIQEHVQNLIDTFLYNGKNITDKDGEIDYMNIANVSNARFVLSIYYERELDLLVPENLAKELKKKIEDTIGLDQLLLKNEKEIDDKIGEITEHDISVFHEYLKSIGWELFDLLDQYIKLHDSIFTFWNILKLSKFFYKKSSWLLITLAKVKNVEDRLERFKKEHCLDVASQEYVICFFEYVAALNKAISLLREWLKMMGDSRGPNKNGYTRAEISGISDQYNKAQEEYSEIGWKLKLLFEKL